MNPITLPISELKPVLTGLGKIIDKRLRASVLDCIRIERTRTGQIELAATDLNTYAIARLDTPTQGDPVAFLIPYEDLHNVAKSCGRGDSLIVAPSEDGVAIRFPVGGQMIEHRCQSAPVRDFPAVAEIPGEPIAIDASLKGSFGEALSCASVDPTRPILNAAFVDVTNPQGHYIVATDGQHLFSSNSFRLPLKDSLIIPSHRFLGWKDFVNDGEWTLRAGVTEQDQPPRFEIASDHWRFTSLSLDGSYPNWRAVIPDYGSAMTTVNLDPASISEVIRMIARMPEHDSEHHAIGLEISGNRCSLLGKSPSSEQWTQIELPRAKATGADMKIFLNRNFLTKALRIGLTRIEVIDPATPLRFSNAGRQMIVMPVHGGGRAPVQSAPVAEARVTAEPETIATTPPSSTTKPETRKPMPQIETSAQAVAPDKTPETTPKPALEMALSQIEAVKAHYREAIRSLTDLTDLLRQAAREQRASEKEFQSIRQTLRSLQSVRI
jgi:DNA polymerase III sliding clamp (beta) subunit (PCNA family)